MRKLHFVALLVIACPALAAVSPPNIVVIVADDLGYADLGCYGAKEIATPHLDAMAREGFRFTDCSAAAPFCSPSRAALLTGRLPVRCGVPYVLFPAERHGLPADEVTIAELLHERGYATACVGKWHLGWTSASKPLAQGFDEYFGLPYSNDSTQWSVGERFTQVMGLEPLPLIDGERVIEAPVHQSSLTRRYTERAVKFIRDHRDRPFFLYVAHTMPHVPQYASPQFAGKSKAGLYGDVVEELDWSTGVLLSQLRQLNIHERTLVIFTSDNGAPLRPKIDAAKAKGRFAGRNFAGDNSPLRGGKGSTFEGGIRVPAIAWWPATVSAGQTIQEPCSTLDLFPTIAALTGAKLPSDRAFDGDDVSHVLINTAPAHHPRLLFHYFGPQLQAVREGKWKLFVPIDQLPQTRLPSLWFVHQPDLFARQHRLWPKASLYDLDADIGETMDVADSHPDIVRRLLSVAHEFDGKLQPDIHAIDEAPGPPVPAPGEIRQR